MRQPPIGTVRAFPGGARWRKARTLSREDWQTALWDTAAAVRICDITGGDLDAEKLMRAMGWEPVRD